MRLWQRYWYDTTVWDITPCQLTDVSKDSIAFISSVQKWNLSLLDSLTLRWLHYYDPSTRHYLRPNIPRDLKFKIGVLQSTIIASKIKVVIQIFLRNFITYWQRNNIYFRAHIFIFYFHKDSLLFSTVHNIKIVYQLMLLFFNIEISCKTIIML